MNIKRIGILTSGGDAPGMNAVIYSVVKNAFEHNLEVLGVYRGYNGLINGNLKPLNLDDVKDIIKRGGTILYSARCKEFQTGEGLQRAVKTCKDNKIDGLIVVGGDGSFKGANNLSKEGIPCIGIPGTIDNDIACTEYTLGFGTAVNTAIEMVDKLSDTMMSHDRCSVVEVMGRRSGYIALEVGVSVAASYIVLPEVEFDKKDLFLKMEKAMKNGKKHFIVVVAEGLMDVFELAKEIEKTTGVESRATVLGHVQRGGSPIAKDRIAGVQFGQRAVELLLAGKVKRVVGLKSEKIVDYDILEGLALDSKFPKDLYDVAKKMF